MIECVRASIRSIPEGQRHLAKVCPGVGCEGQEKTWHGLHVGGGSSRPRDSKGERAYSPVRSNLKNWMVGSGGGRRLIATGRDLKRNEGRELREA